MAGLLGQLGVGQADVLGFSLGGEVALQLALDHHDFFRLEHAVEMHALIPGAQLAVLPGATHMGLMRRADLMIGLVRDFLG